MLSFRSRGGRTVPGGGSKVPAFVSSSPTPPTYIAAGSIPEPWFSWPMGYRADDARVVTVSGQFSHETCLRRPVLWVGFGDEGELSRDFSESGFSLHEKALRGRANHHR